MLRLVLDTQVWIDWLVFGDASTRPLEAALSAGRAVIVIDRDCHAELERVLGYRLGRIALSAEEQRAHAGKCLEIAQFFPGAPAAGQAALPRCADPDDQKFLELAAAARADFLVTRDQELLALAPRAPGFRIVTAQEFDQQPKEPQA